MELSEAAKKYRFPDGEYKNCAPSEMLNQYLLIQYMDYLTRSPFISKDIKNIYNELIDYAYKKYEWVQYIIKK